MNRPSHQNSDRVKEISDPTNGMRDLQYPPRGGQLTDLERYRADDPINARPPLNVENFLRGHGTNCYTVSSAISKSNLQLVPDTVRDRYEILSSTGESSGSRDLNRHFVSVVDLNYPSSDCDSIIGYANKSSTPSVLVNPQTGKINPRNPGFLVTLDNLEGLRESQRLLEAADLSEVVDYQKVKAGIQQRAKRIELLDKGLVSMGDEERSRFNELSRIPAVVFGDHSGQEFKYVDSAVSNEIGVERLNIRAIAVPESHKSHVESVVNSELDRFGYNDELKIVSIEDLQGKHPRRVLGWSTDKPYSV